MHRSAHCRTAGTTWWATTRRAPDAALVHFTLGGPYFAAYRDCEYAAAWRAEREAMLYAEERSPRAAAKSASGQSV